MLVDVQHREVVVFVFGLLKSSLSRVFVII